jgi:ribosomal protein L29
VEKKKQQAKFNKLSLKELQSELPKLEKKLDSQLKQKFLGKLDKSQDLVIVRKNIARVKTFITLKEILEKGSKQPALRN